MAEKPAPDPFLKAAERLGVEPQLGLALEDSQIGIRSASSADMITVMMPDLLEPTEDIRGLCTVIVRDLYEMRSLILVEQTGRGRPLARFASKLSGNRTDPLSVSRSSAACRWNALKLTPE